MNRVLAALTLLVMLFMDAPRCLATTDPILDIYGPSLPVHPPAGAQTGQGPRLDQRGVDLDGTLRLPAALGWSIAGDPLGGGYATGRTLGDVNLFTGSYHPTEVDLSFPSLGLPVVIGRTYSNVQQDGTGTAGSSIATQGWNWNQVAQPEIVLWLGATNDLDVLYLYYGADRFIEFKRIALNATEFKAKNGAAGVVKFTAAVSTTPETYTYYDQRGNQIVFLGFDGNAQYGTGQIWKMIDPAGNVAYVYDASNSAAVGSTGYDSFGGVTVWYDASGRRYTFTYSTYGIYRRIQRVEAEINSGGWTSVGKVEYDYYTTTINDVGFAGDLKTVTLTQPGVTSGPYVRTKYYRYYTRAWSNSDGRRGEAHALKMVVGFDGVRQRPAYASDTDATLLPYSEMYFEYPSGDRRLASVTVNGNCGCAGGTSGTYSFTYGDSSGYATAVANTSYDAGWGRRTIIAQPDGAYVTQHFDETGAVLGRVLSAASPANWASGSGSNKTWITDVERNSSGQVTAIHAPANVTAYTHSTAAMTYSSSAGLVTVYTRHAASDNLDGLRDSVSVKEGTSGAAGLISSITMADVQLVVGSAGVSTPKVTHSKTYPAGGSTGLDTAITTTYWSGTSTNVLYLAPKSVQVDSPIVLTASNGSNSVTTTYRYLRQDGTTVYTKDAGGILFYTRQDGFGQTITQISDCDTASGDIAGGDAASTWSISTAGTAIHAKTTMTYDDEGRILTRTQPSVAGTRTTTWKYVLDSARLGTFSSPLFDGTDYYGPLSYTRVNHNGSQDRRATIEINSPGSSIPTSTTPTATSGTAWSGLVDTVYDQSGMRVAERWTYLTTSTSDKAYTGYDSMGRIARSQDATGTITRTEFDERGLPVRRFMGSDDVGATNPSGSGSSNNMVKIAEMEYDNAAAWGGGNGNLTTSSQDSSGAWSGGVGDRVTTMTYDYRNRAVVTLGPVAPYRVSKFDNSNRVTATAVYNSTSGLSLTTDPSATSASTRVGLNETSYDERGQVFKTLRYEINQGTGAKVTSQVTENWYDADRRPIKTHGPQVTKTLYDRLGRVTEQFVLAKVNDSAYADATGVSGDVVIEQTHLALHGLTGKLLATWLVQRAHDDNTSGTLSVLDTNADSDPMKLTAANLQANSRAQIAGYWYDDWDRMSESVQFGTYGGTFDRNTTSGGTPACPARSDSALRTTYGYDNFGRMQLVTDPAGVFNATLFDFAGRRTATIDNLTNGTPHTTAGTDNDQDRRINYAYTNGLVTSVTREMPGVGTDQTTAYSYDTTGGSSQVKVKNLLALVTNPDSTTTSYTFNALAQVATTTDPAGNVITAAYDAGGRVTSRVVTTFATTPYAFDTRVEEIDNTYEARGMLNGVKQKDSGGTVLDEIAMTFDGWGNLQTSTQDPDSAIGAASGRDEFVSGWSWAKNTASGGWRNLYLTDWTQPDGGGGMFCAPTYTALGLEVDAQVKRPIRISDDTTIVAEYCYMGLSTVIGVKQSESLMKNAYSLYSTGSSGYGTYMDNFNRSILNSWSRDIAGGIKPKVVNLATTYDRVNNAVTVVDNVLMDAGSNHNFDVLNTYDALRRLKKRSEGAATFGPAPAIAAPVRAEEYERNIAGRITNDKVDLDGSGVVGDGSLPAIDAGELDDARIYNNRNQLLTRDYFGVGYPSTGGVTAPTVTLAYDANGNMVSDGEKYDYVYNPWGQLVELRFFGTMTVAMQFRYNGLGQRIGERLDANNSINNGHADSQITAADPWFYIAVDPKGRRLATFRDTDTYPKETFVYHLTGAGATGAVGGRGASGPNFANDGGVLLRARDAALSDPTLWATTAGNATRGERNYYCSDFRGNVTAMVASGGGLVEQTRYSPSGIPITIPFGDIDGNGSIDFNGEDTPIVNALWDVMPPAMPTYEDRADLNLDGTVDATDEMLITTNWKEKTVRGEMSAPWVGNRSGMCGSEMSGEGLNALALTPCGGMLSSGLSRSLQDGSSSRVSANSSGDFAGQNCGVCIGTGVPDKDPISKPVTPIGGSCNPNIVVAGVSSSGMSATAMTSYSNQVSTVANCGEDPNTFASCTDPNASCTKKCDCNLEAAFYQNCNAYNRVVEGCRNQGTIGTIGSGVGAAAGAVCFFFGGPVVWTIGGIAVCAGEVGIGCSVYSADTCVADADKDRTAKNREAYTAWERCYKQECRVLPPRP